MRYSNLILVALLLVLESFGNSLLQDIRTEERSTTGQSNICSRNSACKYAICLRRNSFSRACSFVPLLLNSNCVCPSGQICTINTDMSALIPPFVYHYHCRDPWHALGFPKF